MVHLYDQQTEVLIGIITHKQLQFLLEQLEEEDSEDRDYYIDRGTLDWFREQGVDPVLASMLREAMGERDGMDIRWSND
jgi:processive 1,2-diacylglycerol beta-glucosyltransferase